MYLSNFWVLFGCDKFVCFIKHPLRSEEKLLLHPNMYLIIFVYILFTSICINSLSQYINHPHDNHLLLNRVILLSKHGLSFYTSKFDVPQQRLASTIASYSCDCSTIQQVSYKRAFVIPNIHGLCNRLQLISGIYYLSSRDNIPILISSSMFWKTLWNLTEKFDNQFVEISDEQIYCLSNSSVHYSFYFNFYDNMSVSALYKAYHTHSNSLFFKNYSIITGNTVTLKWLYMDTKGYFDKSIVVSNLGVMMKHLLIPTDLLLSKMKYIYPNYGEEKYTGIHIRCGGVLCDSKIGEMLPPAECYKFLNYSINISGKKYIALDSSILKSKLHNTTSNIVFNHNEIRNVDSSIQSPYSVKEFLIESAAELMLLGNSNRCIGTFISSFSHIACSMSKFRNDSLFYYRNNQLVNTGNVHL